jgi:hypothetical protein
MKATDNIMKSMMGYLYTVLTDAEDSLVETNERERFICWCLPGIPFEPEDLRFAVRGFTGQGDTPEKKAEDTALLIGQASRFARLVDFVPDANAVFGEEKQIAAFMRNENSLARLYERVLKQSQVAATELTKEEKEKVERFRNVLYPEVEAVDPETGNKRKRRVEGPELKAYKEFQGKYEDAISAFNIIRIKAQNPTTPDDSLILTFNGPTLKARVKTALADWETNGFKSEVETIQAFIAAVTQRDLNLWKADLVDRFGTSRLLDALGQEFFATSLVPGGFAFSDQGWSKFKFNEKEVDTFSKFKSTQFEGKTSFGWGPLSVGGGAEGGSSSKKEISNVSNFEMEFAVTQIPLVRAWFDPTFLESRAWKLGPNALELTQLSDGGDPPKGMLVAYPTSVIFARDIRINFNEMHDETSEINKTLKAKGNAGYGPFKISGSYTRDSKEKKVQSDLTERGLEVKGLQILGFRCRLLKKSPDPLPGIKNFT